MVKSLLHQMISENRVNHAHFIMAGYHRINASLGVFQKAVLHHKIIIGTCLIGHARLFIRLYAGLSRLSEKGRVSAIELEPIDTKGVPAGAGLVCKQGALDEIPLHIVLGTTMFGHRVHPQIIITVESMLTRFKEARDVPAGFLDIAMACQSRKSRYLMLRGFRGLVVKSESASALCFGILETEMRRANVLFESELATIPLSAAISIPSRNFLRGRKVCFTTGEPFLAFVDCANVDGQISLLGKAAIAAGNCTRENFSFFQGDIAVCYLKMAA